MEKLELTPNSEVIATEHPTASLEDLKVGDEA